VLIFNLIREKITYWRVVIYKPDLAFKHISEQTPIFKRVKPMSVLIASVVCAYLCMLVYVVCELLRPELSNYIKPENQLLIMDWAADLWMIFLYISFAIGSSYGGNALTGKVEKRPGLGKYVFPAVFVVFVAIQLFQSTGPMLLDTIDYFFKKSFDKKNIQIKGVDASNKSRFFVKDENYSYFSRLVIPVAGTNARIYFLPRKRAVVKFEVLDEKSTGKTEEVSNAYGK
jgi:hypothetical protein